MYITQTLNHFKMMVVLSLSLSLFLYFNHAATKNLGSSEIGESKS